MENVPNKNTAEKETAISTNTRKEYELTAIAKSKRFEVTPTIEKTKFNKRYFLAVKLITAPTPYTQKHTVAEDVKGLIASSGKTNFVAKFCEGIEADTGRAYIGLDIDIDGYNERAWFTVPEKIMLVKAGLLKEVK